MTLIVTMVMLTMAMMKHDDAGSDDDDDDDDTVMAVMAVVAAVVLVVWLYRSQGSPDVATGTRWAICIAGCAMATRSLCWYQGSATSLVKGA